MLVKITYFCVSGEILLFVLVLIHIRGGCNFCINVLLAEASAVKHESCRAVESRGEMTEQEGERIRCSERGGHGWKSEWEATELLRQRGRNGGERRRLHIAFNDIIMASGVYNLARWRNGRCCSEWAVWEGGSHTRIPLSGSCVVTVQWA